MWTWSKKNFSIKKKKEFEEYYWPLFENKNPNVPKSKWVMLVAAKWREFEILRKDREAGLEEEDDKVKVPLIKSGRKSTGSGTKRKSKLKIKLGHKKNGSDREEGEKHIEDSDEEFEKMFKKMKIGKPKTTLPRDQSDQTQAMMQW